MIENEIMDLYVDKQSLPHVRIQPPSSLESIFKIDKVIFTEIISNYKWHNAIYFTSLLK